MEKDEALNYFADKLKKKRLERKLTQKELAELVGLSDSTITLYEKGERDPRRSTLHKIADALGVSVDYFFSYNDSKITINPTSDLVKMPIMLLGSASCGNGFFNEQNIIEYIDLPKTWSGNNVFAAYAHGDSMIGSGIVNGSVVILKEQPYLENNQIGVFHYNGEEYIKKYRLIGSSILLQSTNPSYNDIEVTENDDFRIIAKVIKVITELD